MRPLEHLPLHLEAGRLLGSMSRRYGRSSNWQPDDYVLDDFPLLVPTVLRNDPLAAKEYPLQEVIQLLALVRGCWGATERYAVRPITFLIAASP